MRSLFHFRLDHIGRDCLAPEESAAPPPKQISKKMGLTLGALLTEEVKAKGRLTKVSAYTGRTALDICSAYKIYAYHYNGRVIYTIKNPPQIAILLGRRAKGMTFSKLASSFISLPSGPLGPTRAILSSFSVGKCI